jgi:hypothetical protein
VTAGPGKGAVKARGGKRRRKAKAGREVGPPRPAKAKEGKSAESGGKSQKRLAPRPLPDRPDSGPDFLCVGAQKGGTRWLYDQLQLHPDFWMPPVKELHYFDRRSPSAASVNLGRRAEENLERTNRRQAKLALRPLDRRDIDFLAAYVAMPWWRTDLEAYARLFSLKGNLLSGDITPDYSTLSDRQIARIMRRFPNVKVVFIARDPVERVWSHLTMHMRRGTIARGLDADDVMRLMRRRFVRERSYPSEIAARWRRHVPGEQFGLFLFDDLVADADGLRRRVLSFLGGDPARESGVINAAFNRKEDREKVPLPPAIRTEIARHFATEIKASAAAFGGAAKGWAEKYGLGPEIG